MIAVQPAGRTAQAVRLVSEVRRLRYHDSSTACAGPYVRNERSVVLQVIPCGAPGNAGSDRDWLLVKTGVRQADGPDARQADDY